MNMSFITITYKSGRDETILNVHSVAMTSGLLIITYEGNDHHMDEKQFKMESIERIFIN